MPKQLHEITKFTSGTITVPDVKDIAEDAASYSLNIDSVTASGKLQGVPADIDLTAGGTFQSAAQPEIINIVCVADDGGSLDEKYFDLYGATGKTLVWFDVGGGGSAPSGTANGGYALTIEITLIDSGDTASAVAIAIAEEVGDHADFITTVYDDVIVVQDAANASRTNAFEGDSGFTITVFQQGASGTTALTVDADVAVMINKARQRDVIYYENDTNKYGYNCKWR